MKKHLESRSGFKKLSIVKNLVSYNKIEVRLINNNVFFLTFPPPNAV